MRTSAVAAAGIPGSIDRRQPERRHQGAKRPWNESCERFLFDTLGHYEHESPTPRAGKRCRSRKRQFPLGMKSRPARDSRRRGCDLLGEARGGDGRTLRSMTRCHQRTQPQIETRNLWSSGFRRGFSLRGLAVLVAALSPLLTRFDFTSPKASALCFSSLCGRLQFTALRRSVLP